ncbi:aldo/keto reductase [Cubamyces sp. BRFM 1775]|nr:aldo/keto reductase [Cubamyces sp. BRFM 1775]
MVVTTTLGGTASHITVGKVAHGLMMMTWRPVPIPDEEAFETIKAGVDTLPPGVKMLLNGGAFYANDGSTLNLELLSRFYAKYPEYAEKTFLSVKGACKPNHEDLQIDCSPEGLRRSVDEILRVLKGTKKLDLFQPARIDPKVSVEDTVRTLAQLVNEGKFDHIGLSECSANTLRRGNSVYPISIVEIEVSPTSYEEETKKVIATAAELGLAVAGYSPLGKGLLTGTITNPGDLHPDDMRNHYTRFQEENLRHNIAIADALRSIAAKKGCTAAQLCIGWVGSLGDKVIPLPGSSSKKRVLENLGGGDVILTEEEKQEIARVLEEHPVKGGRYGEKVELALWG